MKRYAFFFIAALTGLVFFGVHPVQAENVNETVQLIEKHYQEVKDLSAKVTQKNFLKALDKTQVFEGMLRIKKPGKLRLDYTNGQLILIDGKEALFYSKKSEQVIKKTFTDFEHMNIPVAFLLGAARIRDDFNMLQPDAKTAPKLELIPKKSGAAMEKLRVIPDEAGRISQLTIYDRSGNVTEIAFKEVREDIGLQDKEFRFKVPKGTEVIEQ